jgi:multidrug efflux pump subunit AcrA (membrane-fusion protein)
VIRLQPGLKTTFRFQAFPNEEIEGKIASIDPKITRIQDQQAPRYLVRVDFKVPDKIQQNLYFGMTAAISVNLKTDSELYHLPKQAVLYHNQQYWVRKINPETQVVSEIPIQFELVDDHLAAVRQGIAAGDCLVIPG